MKKNLKLIIPEILKKFDPAKPAVLLTDASRLGLGYILIQLDVKPEGHEEDNLAKGITKHTAKKVPKGHLITCGTRFLSNAEKNYAVIELELLAIQWAVDKCWMYLAGTEFAAKTDHQPLVGILNGKNLDAISNRRINRIVSKLINYQFRLLWTPDKIQLIADALSMAPVFPQEEERDVLVCTVRAARVTNNEALKDLA